MIQLFGYFLDADSLAIIGIILAVIGIIVAICVPSLIERLKRPKLVLSLVAEQIPVGTTVRFLHGRVVNKPQSGFTGVERNPAIDVRLKMEYFDKGKTLLFPAIEGKWDSSADCITPVAKIEIHHTSPPSVNSTNVSEFDIGKIPFAHKTNIVSSEQGETFAIVVKHTKIPECFAFNGWSYQFPNWSDPKWMIGTGEFQVRITAYAGNSSITKSFILRNNGPNLTDLSIAEK